MSRIVAAIDPGKDGAWAVHGSGAEGFYTYAEARDGCPVRDIIADLKNSGVTFVVIEKLVTMPGKGTATSWTTSGIDWGGIYHGLQIAGIGVKVIAPTEWKKHFGLLKSEKSASIALARQFFPNIPLRRNEQCRVDDHNMAEALLILKFGLEKELFV
jgi:crossover junction endodeoxyribonuclease RuvC